MKVEFIDVGMNKKSWSAEISDLFHEELFKEVKKNGDIMSQNIDFTYDNETNSGQVIVGGFRIVGTFKVLDIVH